MSDENIGAVDGIATPIPTEQPNDTVPAADTEHPLRNPETYGSTDDIVAAVVAALRPALERTYREVNNLYATLGLRKPE